MSCSVDIWVRAAGALRHLPPIAKPTSSVPRMSFNVRLHSVLSLMFVPMTGPYNSGKLYFGAGPHYLLFPRAPLELILRAHLPAPRTWTHQATRCMTLRG